MLLVVTIQSRFGFKSHVAVLAFKGSRVRVRDDVFQISASQLESLAAFCARLVVDELVHLHILLARESPIASRMRAFEPVQLLLALESLVSISASFALEYLVAMLAGVSGIRMRVQMLPQMLRLDKPLVANFADVFASLLFLIIRIVRIILPV